MRTVCIGVADSIGYYEGGGLLWMFLNWALGFRRLGYRVIWADSVDEKTNLDLLLRRLNGLRERLAPFGLADSIALVPKAGQKAVPELAKLTLSEEDAAAADLLFSLRYNFPRRFVDRFKRSCIFETDPGILQAAVADGVYDLRSYSVHYTNSPAVANRTHPLFDCGIHWEYLPTGVCVEEWPVTEPPRGAAFTTVTQWWMHNVWMRDAQGTWYANDKRTAFQPFLGLPKRVGAPMELAINLGDDKEDRPILQSLGWHVRDAHTISSTPIDFRAYIQSSLGEWSCAKPSYVKMQTAWVSDRSVCYLASGRPCIVQHTGPSEDLPDRLGMLRFRTLDEAAEMIQEVIRDYPRHSRAARELAEQRFSVTKSIPRILDRIQ